MRDELVIEEMAVRAIQQKMDEEFRLQCKEPSTPVKHANRRLQEAEHQEPESRGRVLKRTSGRLLRIPSSRSGRVQRVHLNFAEF